MTDSSTFIIKIMRWLREGGILWKDDNGVHYVPNAYYGVSLEFKYTGELHWFKFRGMKL